MWSPLREPHADAKAERRTRGTDPTLALLSFARGTPVGLGSKTREPDKSRGQRNFGFFLALGSS